MFIKRFLVAILTVAATMNIANAMKILDTNIVDTGCLENPIDAPTMCVSKVFYSDFRKVGFDWNYDYGYSSKEASKPNQKYEIVDTDNNVETVKFHKVLPKIGQYLGKFTYKKANVSLDIYWGGNQWAVDGVRSCYANSDAGIPGDMNRYVILGDHNYQSGKRMADTLKKGDKVTIETSYGIYTYKYTGSKIATTATKKTFIPESVKSRYKLPYDATWDEYIFENSSNKKLTAGSWSSSADGDLYFRTCYPLNNRGRTNQVYVMIFNFVSGPQVV